MTELAWAAGFFDGEGNTECGGKRISMTLAQNDRDILERFLSAVEHGKIRYHKRAGGRNIWRWQLCQVDDIREVLDKLDPYLFETKRQQALTALARYEAFPVKRRARRKVPA